MVGEGRRDLTHRLSWTLIMATERDVLSCRILTINSVYYFVSDILLLYH